MMGEPLGVLPQDRQAHGDVEPVENVLGARKHVHGHRDLSTTLRQRRLLGHVPVAAVEVAHNRWNVDTEGG